MAVCPEFDLLGIIPGKNKLFSGVNVKSSCASSLGRTN